MAHNLTLLDNDDGETLYIYDNDNDYPLLAHLKQCFQIAPQSQRRNVMSILQAFHSAMRTDRITAFPTTVEQFEDWILGSDASMSSGCGVLVLQHVFSCAGIQDVISSDEWVNTITPNDKVEDLMEFLGIKNATRLWEGATDGIPRADLNVLRWLGCKNFPPSGIPVYCIRLLADVPCEDTNMIMATMRHLYIPLQLGSNLNQTVMFIIVGSWYNDLAILEWATSTVGIAMIERILQDFRSKHRNFSTFVIILAGLASLLYALSLTHHWEYRYPPLCETHGYPRDARQITWARTVADELANFWAAQGLQKPQFGDCCERALRDDLRQFIMEKVVKAFLYQDPWLMMRLLFNEEAYFRTYRIMEHILMEYRRAKDLQKRLTAPSSFLTEVQDHMQAVSLETSPPPPGS